MAVLTRENGIADGAMAAVIDLARSCLSESLRATCCGGRGLRRYTLHGHLPNMLYKKALVKERFLSELVLLARSD